PTLAGLAVLVLYRLLTGSWVGSSVADKSLLANYTFADAVALVSEYLTDVIRGLLLGFYPSRELVGSARGMAPFYFPPLALALALVAFAATRPPLSSALRAWAAATLATLAAVVPNTFLGVHFNRYLMWSFPALLALTAAGLGALTGRFAERRPERERPLFFALGGLFLVLGLLSAARFAAVYGEMAGDIARRDVAAAEWMRRSLPPDTVLANVAGGAEYLSGHRVMNLHGVTSAAFLGNRTAEREANTLEGLGRLGATERPSHLITSVARDNGSPALHALVQEPPLYRTLSLSDELLVYRMRYDALDRAARPLLPETMAAVAGRALVDSLNVCDTRDERAHDSAFRSQLDGVRLHGT
ncbi:MAG TPA: hypothetical protein VFO85_17785, partial [Vicinamibacteria bacterium]|nr:hypothetical protein [Vicinamibacteria bacterium]